MTILKIPTSQAGFLPGVLESINNQQLAIEKAEPKATKVQAVLIRLAASVGVIFAAVADECFHLAMVIVKPVGIGFKVTVAKWVGIDKYMSDALSCKEWQGHAYKLYANVVMFAKAFVLMGVYDPEIMLNTGRKMAIYVPASDGRCGNDGSKNKSASVAPVAAGAS
jgi:hypothetical protein